MAAAGEVLKSYLGDVMRMVLEISGVAFAAFLAYHCVCGFIEGWSQEKKPKLRVIWYEPVENSKK
jgi:hypothetical protein